MIEKLNIASAIESLMCQALIEKKQLTIKLSVITTEIEQPKKTEKISWDGIDPIFMKDLETSIANNR
jgi:hypothetical protein